MRKHDWQPPSLKPTAVKQCVSFILTFALKMDGLSPLGEIIWAQPCPWCDAFLSPSGTGVSSPPWCAGWVSHSRTQNNCLIQCHHYVACRQSHQAFPRKLAAFHKSFAQSSSPEGTEMSQLHGGKRITNKYLSRARSFMEDWTEWKSQLKCFIFIKVYISLSNNPCLISMILFPFTFLPENGHLGDRQLFKGKSLTFYRLTSSWTIW